jgi:hypothetical protein
MADSPLLSGFNADGFRNNIRNTMIMGLPNDSALKPTFFFRATMSYPPGTVMDPEGRPIDPRVQATATYAADPIQVPCAVEWGLDNSNNENLSGTMWEDRATLTLLDTEYTQVSQAIEVDLGGRRFLIQKVIPLALGTVDIYQLQVFLKGTDG